MEIIEKRIDEVIPYEKNPRKNDAAVESVAASIREFGFRQPIILDAEGVIICGHTRLKAAKKLGLETVPCVIAEDLTPEQVKAYRLADNMTAQLAEWDNELLEQELAGIKEMDMTIFGFPAGEVPESEVQDDDYIVEPPVTSETKRGDIFILGGGTHRIMCGDATCEADVAALMEGEKAGLYLTDPPYNVDYGEVRDIFEAKKRRMRTDGLVIMNDSMEDSVFRQFLTDAFRTATTAMRPGAGFYIWHAETEGINFREAAEAAGLHVRQCLIWVKSSLALGRQDYQWRHEPCLYGWAEGKHYFIPDRTQTTVQGDERPNYKRMKKEELVDLLEKMEDETPQTVIHEDKPAANAEHPTMKPIKLLARLIRNSTIPGDIILDTFGGSGSTLIAAHQLNRRCYTMELDPRFVDVIVDRWEKLTGQKAEKLSHNVAY